MKLVPTAPPRDAYLLGLGLGNLGNLDELRELRKLRVRKLRELRELAVRFRIRVRVRVRVRFRVKVRVRVMGIFMVEISSSPSSQAVSTFLIESSAHTNSSPSGATTFNPKSP